MLMRAQEFDPVLTYWICKLIFDSEKKGEQVRNSFQTRRIFRGSDLGWLFESPPIGKMHDIVKMVFHDSTIKVSSWGTRSGDDKDSTELIARIEFKQWLEKLNLQFDDEMHFVTIPA